MALSSIDWAPVLIHVYCGCHCGTIHQRHLLIGSSVSTTRRHRNLRLIIEAFELEVCFEKKKKFSVSKLTYRGQNSITHGEEWVPPFATFLKVTTPVFCIGRILLNVETMSKRCRNYVETMSKRRRNGVLLSNVRFSKSFRYRSDV